jgi:hypothetical protein
VRDHILDYPGGPPRPIVKPAPVFKCGVRTGVGNLLSGGNVWITADGAEVGRVNGCAQQQGVNVAPPYGLGQKVRAWFEICHDPSPPSIEHITQAPPNPLPQLSIDPAFEGGNQVVVRNVVDGARVTLFRNGTPIGPYGCWGGSLVFTLSPMLGGTETLAATQAMCPGDPDSPPVKIPVQPCSALPAPQVGPIQGGDDRVTLMSFVPGASVRVYINNVIAGVGGAPVILLNRRIKRGDTVHIVQDLAGCKGQLALEVKVGCVDPPFAADPSALDLFPVGWLEYGTGGIKGSVYYPADDDGKSQPFNKRLANLGRVPIVFMAHGNHNPADPSYLGYDYFQRDLAKMGIIAVSIDCNALNGVAGSIQNILDRAELIYDNIAHFQGLDADAASPFHQKIDFARTGLMGHSRGGDAVVMGPAMLSLPGVTIRSALALAPTNFRFSNGQATIAPNGHAFMTILPAGDGDVKNNNGAQFYDLASPGPFKSQIYAHFTNHNFFNRRWLEDDSLLTQPQPAVISRTAHEQILTAYGCAFYRASLLGHATTAYLSGHLRPSGPMTEHVHLSYQQDKATTVDNHEELNDIGVNSMLRPTTQLAGLSAREHTFRQVNPNNPPLPAGAPGTFNGTFFGESTGMVVARGAPPNGVFRSELDAPADITRREIWIRAAEVTNGSTVPGGASGFKLGVEDKAGRRSWIDSDEVGGLPRPYARDPGRIKTMLNTHRFHGQCFTTERDFDPTTVVAILLRCDRPDERAIAFDDLQLV